MSVVKEKKEVDERPVSSNSFVQNLFTRGVYKRSQGRVARQVTFFAIVVTLGVGVWRMSDLALMTSLDAWAVRSLSLPSSLVRYGLPALMLAAGAWVAYRLVNMPNFADFLIAVEAEMSKVSWPTRTELFRGVVVVLMTIIILTAVLFLFDLIWNYVFQFIGILG